jgi:hypothetical protein
MNLLCRMHHRQPALLCNSYKHHLAAAATAATAAGSHEAISTVWQAAVSAATDPALTSLPAFGGKRPGEAWLVQQLLKGPSAVQHTAMQQHVQRRAAAKVLPGLAASINLQLSLLHPAVTAACKLAQQQGSSLADAPAAAASSAAPGGVLLLESVCFALGAAYSNSSLPANCLQAMTLAVLQLLLQHQRLPKPAALLELLCGAARADAAAGDTNMYNLATEYAQQLQLSEEDAAAVRSAALAGAATAAATQDLSTGMNPLQQLWQATLAAADSAEAIQLVSDGAASAVVAAVAANAAAANSLLASSEALPPPLLVQLLQAAVSGKQAAAVQQLLAHAEQHQLLQQLPPNLLIAALEQGGSSATAAAGGSGSGDLAQQAVTVLLQQGQAPDAAAAAALLPGTAAGEQQWQQLLTWLQEQCSTAPAAAAHSLLCDLLLSSASRQSADQTWQLFQLLQHCQESGSWPAAQQGLPAAVCSALVEQQAAADTAASNSRVVQLWQTSALQQKTKLSTGASTAVASAFVASEQHATALQLVQQQDPALLQHLASLWQQQVPDAGILAQALQQLCESSSHLDGAAAA